MPEGVAGANDGGYSFIEVLIAVVLLALTFVAAMGGLASSITVTDYHHEESQVEVVLNSAAEKVKVAPYKACNVAVSAYQASAGQAATDQAAADPRWTASQVAVTVQSWNWATGVYGPCTDNAPQGSALQLITINVQHPDGRVGLPAAKCLPNPSVPACRTLSVVKSG